MTVGPAQQDELAAFLECLFGDLPEGLWGYIWTRPDRHTFWFQAPAVAVDYVRSQCADRDVYVGLALANRPGRKDQRVACAPDPERPDAIVAAGIVALGADVDFGTDGHSNGKRYPPDGSTALAVVTSLPLPPTLAVHSGGGTQPWWVLKEPWVFEDDAERQQARDLLSGWGDVILLAAQRHGYEVDSVHDLARVLGVPGSGNCKDPATAAWSPDPRHRRPVKLLGTHDEQRYSAEDFIGYLPARSDAQDTGTGEHLDLDDMPPAGDAAMLQRSGALLQQDDALRATWARTRDDLKDSSPSGYGMALANRLALKHRWTAGELAWALQHSRREHSGHKPLHPRKLRLTVSKALTAAGRAPTGSAAQTKPEKLTTDAIAEAILRQDQFAQDVGGRLYAFVDGVCQDHGKRFVRTRVKQLLRERGRLPQWSTYRTDEVHGYILADAPELWEQPPIDTLNVLNGLLDVTTGTLRAHEPSFLSPIQSPVVYGSDADCPAWRQFVTDVFPEDCQELPWEVCAWLMLPHRSTQKAVLLLGEGSNGKSTWLTALIAFLGRRNVTGISLHKLEADRFALSRLLGRLANVCPDLPSSHLVGTNVFKALTGGDQRLEAEYKHRDGFSFEPFTRLVFSANHPPRSEDASHAFFRRWLVAPFGRTFEEGSDAIPREELDARLCQPSELSGVLNKALEVLPRVRRHGITESASMRAAWAEFRHLTDPVAVWLDQRTVDEPEAVTAKSELPRAYNEGTRQDGRPNETPTAFGKAVRRARPGLKDARRTIGGRVQWCWVGLGLRALDMSG
jgi:P4 family phage/plasmid primase-like protien